MRWTGPIVDDVEQQKGADVDERGIRPPEAYALEAGPRAPGAAVLVLRGELDVAAASALREQLAAAPERGLVLDLAGTTFVDSSVLQELLRAREDLRARGARLVLAGAGRPVRRLLELTGTNELFEQVDDAEAGLSRLAG